MSNRLWSPYEIKLLLHFYASQARFEPISQHYHDCIASFQLSGLIEHVDGIPRTTALGNHFVQMLLETPKPVMMFVDPRTNKEVRQSNIEIIEADRPE